VVPWPSMRRFIQPYLEALSARTAPQQPPWPVRPGVGFGGGAYRYQAVNLGRGPGEPRPDANWDIGPVRAIVLTEVICTTPAFFSERSHLSSVCHHIPCALLPCCRCAAFTGVLITIGLTGCRIA
jgi:hypothetical protein